MTTLRGNVRLGLAALGCAVLAVLPCLWARYFPLWMPPFVGVVIEASCIVTGIVAWMALTYRAFQRWSVAAGGLAVLGIPLILMSLPNLFVLGLGTYFDLMKTS